MKRSALALLVCAACALAPRPPASVEVCATNSCSAPRTIALFWSAEAVPFPVEELGEVQVQGAELNGAGFGSPTRQELLEALARKAAQLGADGVAQVEVVEADRNRHVDPIGSLTMMEAEPQSFARGVAVKRRAGP